MERKSRSRNQRQPFLKWPGGKRWIAPTISSMIRPILNGIYYEPFLGGGAVYFHLQPEKAVLSDLNGDLINTYIAVRDHVDDLIGALRRLKVSAQHYYSIRGANPRKTATRAARFLYLNRTAFGGLYRENRQGLFNVPYGGGHRTPEILWKTDLLRVASQSLLSAEIQQADFEPMIERSGKGDVVYCDPSYTVAHNNNCFLRYNEKIFTFLDQKRLSEAARRAVGRGATIIVSNAKHKCIEKLYPYAEKRVVTRFSSMSAKPGARKRTEEMLLVLRP